MQEVTEVKLSADLVNAVLQYMASKPYVEVYQLISEIHKQAGPQLPAAAEPSEVK